MIPTGVYVNGTAAPVEQGMEFGWSPSSGLTYVRTYTGLASEIQAMFFATAGLYSNCTMRQEPGSPIATLVGTKSGSQNGSADIVGATLDLDYEEVSGSIFKNPTFVGITAARVALLGYLKEQSLQMTAAEFAAERAAQALTTVEGAALDLLLLGVESYPWFVPVITYTRIVSSNYTLGFPLGETGLVQTTAQLASYLGSAVVYFAIPTSTPGVATGVTGFTDGWFKRSRVQYMTNNNAQLIETWRYGSYSDHLYRFV